MEREQGNSLLEILLVLAVSSVLIVLAVRYFTVVDLNMRVARAISQVDIISRASYQWLEYERRADFAAISSTGLTADELITQQDVKNPWGGKIDVSAGADNSHVKITLSGLSTYVCKNLVRHLQSIAYSQVTPAACKAGDYYGEF